MLLVNLEVPMAKVGRPLSYKPEYCERVIELGKQGKSYSQMAIACGTVRGTLDYWNKEIPEFSAALALAREHSQNWWEEAGQTGLDNRNFNAQLWLKNISSRFRDDYAERRVNEVVGKDGGPVKIETKVIEATDLDDESLDIIEQALAASLEASEDE